MLVAGIGCRRRFVFLNRNNMRKALKRSTKSRTRKRTEAHMIIVSPVVLLSASNILEEDDVKYSPSPTGGWGSVHTAYSLFLASCSSGHVKQRVAWKRCAQQEERRRRYDHIKAYSKTSVSVFLYYTFSKCFTDFQVVLHELQKKLLLWNHGKIKNGTTSTLMQHSSIMAGSLTHHLWGVKEPWVMFRFLSLKHLHFHSLGIQASASSLYLISAALCSAQVQ